MEIPLHLWNVKQTNEKGATLHKIAFPVNNRFRNNVRLTVTSKTARKLSLI